MPPRPTLTRKRVKGGSPLLPHAAARAVLLQLHASFEVHAVTAAHWASALRIKESRGVRFVNPYR